MSKTWKWQTGLLLFGTLFSIYLLIPSFFFAKVDPKNPDASPWYYKLFPSQRVKLGLDLQGGIHLVLGVDVEKAILDQLNISSKDLKEELKKKGVAKEDLSNVETKILKEEHAIHLIIKEDAANPIDAKKWGEIRNGLRERFSFFHFVPDAEGFGITASFKEEEAKYLKRNSIDQALRVLRNRIDEFGLTEPNITAQGEDRILVQLPGVEDPTRAKELIGRTAQLTFKMVDDVNPILEQAIGDPKKLPDGIKLDFERVEVKGKASERPFLVGENKEQLLKFLEGKIPETHVVHLEEVVDHQTLNRKFRTFVLKSEVLLTGDMLEDARVQVDPQWNRPEVGIRFNAKGSDIFRDLTTEHVKERMAIVLDNVIHSAPMIQTPIAGGSARITLGSFMDPNQLTREAHDLSIVLRAGSLKAPIEILEDRTIGPTLGMDSIRKGMLAFVVGLFLVFGFMAFYYRLSGWLANIALLQNGLFLVAFMVLAQATLTLPGIAGIILTLGMAVDANVIILERIREELRAGRDVHGSIRAGYDRAWWTIFDANITTAIAGIVLLQYGNGPIKGFAVTLLIGLLFSFLTGIYSTRVFYEYLIEKKNIQKVSI